MDRTGRKEANCRETEQLKILCDNVDKKGDRFTTASEDGNEDFASVF